MFLRKLTVLLVPLGLMLLLCLLIPLFGSMDAFFGPLLLGAVLGVMLALLLPLAGATRMREPFAWLLWIPAAVILLILLYQFIVSGSVHLFLHPAKQERRNQCHGEIAHHLHRG